MIEIRTKDIDALYRKFENFEYRRPSDVLLSYNNIIPSGKTGEVFIGRKNDYCLFKWVSFEFVSARARMMALNRGLFVSPFNNIALIDITEKVFGRCRLSAGRVATYMKANSLMTYEDILKLNEYLK